jgi:hypothetical protein
LIIDQTEAALFVTEGVGNTDAPVIQGDAEFPWANPTMPAETMALRFRARTVHWQQTPAER